MRVTNYLVGYIYKRLIFPKVVPHVHFHIIPKPSESDKSGLVIEWPIQKFSKEELEKYHEEIQGKL